VAACKRNGASGVHRAVVIVQVPQLLLGTDPRRWHTAATEEKEEPSGT
jgi:hypothetical protein